MNGGNYVWDSNLFRKTETTRALHLTSRVIPTDTILPAASISRRSFGAGVGATALPRGDGRTQSAVTSSTRKLGVSSRRPSFLQHERAGARAA